MSKKYTDIDAREVVIEGQRFVCVLAICPEQLQREAPHMCYGRTRKRLAKLLETGEPQSLIRMNGIIKLTLKPAEGGGK